MKNIDSEFEATMISVFLTVGNVAFTSVSDVKKRLMRSSVVIEHKVYLGWVRLKFAAMNLKKICHP